MSDYQGLNSHEELAAVLAKEMMVSLISRIKEGNGLEDTQEMFLQVKGNILSTYPSLHQAILQTLKPT